MSGQDDEKSRSGPCSSGAEDYLVKGRGDGDLIARSIRYAIERQRAEEALRESEERFRPLVEGVEDYAIFMLDPAGRIVSWNDGAERIRATERSEAIGEHFSIFYAEEDPTLVSRRDSYALRLPRAA